MIRFSARSLTGLLTIYSPVHPLAESQSAHQVFKAQPPAVCVRARPRSCNVKHSREVAGRSM